MYHKGEIKVQKMIGEDVIATKNGRLITNTIIPGAIAFIENQPMAIVSSINKLGEVWVSLLVGSYDFILVSNPNSITFKLKEINSFKEDVFYKNIKDNNSIGCLFIELASRRRFRVNGKAVLNNETIAITVQESYPNCPKYIQQRMITISDSSHTEKSTSITGKNSTENIKNWIKSADTLFVGSTDINKNLDASHRGGNPGFVEFLENDVLKIPDYKGNSLYNTLGNFADNSSTGLLFINFETKDTLQLTGSASLLFNQNTKEDIRKTNGTGRYWLFTISSWIVTKNHHKANWEFVSYSPKNPS